MSELYTVEPTTCKKDHWGKWEAKTAVLFAEPVAADFGRKGQRVLNITTYRTDRGILLTTASVAIRSDRSETTVLGIGGGGDFSKGIFAEQMKRVLEKDIRNQHARALQLIDALAAEVQSFYANASAA